MAETIMRNGNPCPFCAKGDGNCNYHGGSTHRSQGIKGKMITPETYQEDKSLKEEPEDKSISNRHNVPPPNPDFLVEMEDLFRPKDRYDE